jgi:hypothetical protein
MPVVSSDGGTLVNALRFLHDGLVAERDGRSSAQGQSRAVAVTFDHGMTFIAGVDGGGEHLQQDNIYTREFQSHLKKLFFIFKLFSLIFMLYLTICLI